MATGVISVEALHVIVATVLLVIGASRLVRLSRTLGDRIRRDETADSARSLG